MTYIQDLTTIRDEAASHLATAMTEQRTTQKPSYSVDGRSMSWTEYYSHLQLMLKNANQDLINASGAVEAHTIVLG